MKHKLILTVEIIYFKAKKRENKLILEVNTHDYCILNNERPYFYFSFFYSLNLIEGC